MTDAFQKEFHAAFNAPGDQLTALVERMMNAEVTRRFVNVLRTLRFCRARD